MQPMEVDGHTLRVGASFGFVAVSAPDELSHRLSQADAAMREAKFNGYGVVGYRPGMGFVPPSAVHVR